ncbi:MAG TPA: SDR family oxidoreductase [Kofleriaceae bacterium]|nr:SDR family oxidoreductase [Kofleriaceae bacterium]
MTSPSSSPSAENGAGAAREHVLVTGFPSFTARRMIAKVVAADSRARCMVLARDKFAADAETFLGTLPEDHSARVEVIVGDVCDMDLGLAGSEYRDLAARITTIHHLAGIYYMGVDRATARQVNVAGTRGVLELASEATRLRRLCHYSTAQVSGKRKGVILEEDLDENQSFHNVYEETKLEAEKLTRDAMRQLPITVFRPGVIVGDSRTGEIDKFDGPYYLMVLIATNDWNVRLPLPGRGTAPMHLVPIDYMIDAAYALSMDERAAGKTLHLTDPNPFSARQVCELVAERAQVKAPRGYIPGSLARTLLRAPGVEKLARAPVAFLESFDHQVLYNSRTALSLLEGTGLSCPPFDSYVENLVRYVQEVRTARRARPESEESTDPLDA